MIDDEKAVLVRQHSDFGVIAMALGGFHRMYKEDLYISRICSGEL